MFSILGGNVGSTVGSPSPSAFASKPSRFADNIAFTVSPAPGLVCLSPSVPMSVVSCCEMSNTFPKFVWQSGFVGVAMHRRTISAVVLFSSVCKIL